MGWTDCSDLKRLSSSTTFRPAIDRLPSMSWYSHRENLAGDVLISNLDRVCVSSGYRPMRRSHYPMHWEIDWCAWPHVTVHLRRLDKQIVFPPINSIKTFIDLIPGWLTRFWLTFAACEIDQVQFTGTYMFFAVDFTSSAHFSQDSKDRMRAGWIFVHQGSTCGATSVALVH